jgi:propionyl-CoA carboxylase alpha chain
MLAKVIAHAPTRAEAAARLARALRTARIHGVTTNRDLLVRVLEHHEFVAGATDTAFLDRHGIDALAAPLLDPTHEPVYALAAAFARQAAHRQSARVWSRLPSGWRNNPSQPQQLTLRTGDRDVVVDYAFSRTGVTAAVDGTPVDVDLHEATPTSIDLTVDGVRRVLRVAIDGAGIDVDSPLGSSEFTVLPRLPDPAAAGVAAGAIVAPMPGSVVRVLVAPGDAVVAGQPLVVLEAMKMEHTVAAAVDGAVTEVTVTAGQQVEAGAVLVVVETNSEENADAD